MAGEQDGPAGRTRAPAPRGARLWRVRDRATMLALRHRSASRVRRGPVTVAWVAGDPRHPPKVAFAIGRRVGGAVVRNRLRRRLRAIIGDLGPTLAPGAYLVGAAPEAAALSFGELRSRLTEALAAATEGHR